MEHNWKVVAQCSWVNIFQSGSSVLFLVHMCLQLQMHLFVRQHTAHRWIKGFLFCLNNIMCGGGWRIYVSHWEVDICWFHHFLIPLGGSQICLGGGVSSVEGNQEREREGEIKSLTDIISTIFSNLPEGWATNYSVHMHVTQSDMGGRCLEISCW